MREHYALTLRRWSADLEVPWDGPAGWWAYAEPRLAPPSGRGGGERRIAEIGIHQVSAVKLDEEGHERDAPHPAGSMRTTSPAVP